MGTTWPSQTWQLPWVTLENTCQDKHSSDSEAAGTAAHSTAALPSLAKGSHSSTLRFLCTAGLFFLLLFLTQPIVPFEWGLAGVFWPVPLSGAINQWQETAQGSESPVPLTWKTTKFFCTWGWENLATSVPMVKLHKDSNTTVWNDTAVFSCPQHHTLLPLLSCQHQCSGTTTANHSQGTELKWVKFIPFCNVHAFHGAAPSTWTQEQPGTAITLSKFISYSGYCGTK